MSKENKPSSKKSNDGGSDKQSLSSAASSVPFLDTLVLGPLDKYEKYGKFPWKLLVHIIMLFLVTLEVVVILVPDIDFSATF